MSRPIDADALKTKKVRSKERHEWVVPVAEIDWMPTIEERKNGKWIPLQVSMAHPPYQCSCCFRNAPMVETGCLVNRHLEALLTDWCPWCGADMRGEGEK